MRIVLLALLLSGCSVGADEASMRSQGIFHCVDLRDGEQFDYDSATVRDVQLGLAGAPSRMTVTDTTGRVRYATSEQSAYIKCSPRKAEVSK